MTPTIVCDAATLRWVGREIDASLEEARGALERYVEGEGDPQLVSTCLDRVHQVGGTLLLIELHGAAMFADELEAVVRMLPTARGERSVQAVEALMSGLVALPDYLAELRRGAADVPVSLLALMNDLRAVRDAPLLSETALFAPGLDHFIDAGVDLPGSPSDELTTAVRLARREFHQGLLGWLGNGGKASMDMLVNVIADWQEAAGTSRVARLFEAAGTVIEGVREGAIEGSVAVKRLVGTLDRVLKRILEHGEYDIIRDYPFDLLKNLAYYIATAGDSATPAIRELKTRYRLAVPAPSESRASQDASLLGMSPETYDTVRGLLRGELTAIKDRLDIALHASTADPAALRQLTPLLRKLSDTFGMLGLGNLRQRLLAQVDNFEHALADGGLPDEAVLMALAGDLVFAESSVEGGGLRLFGDGAHAVVRAEPQAVLTAGELAHYRERALGEAGEEFAFIKQAVSALVAAPQNVETVSEVPRRLRLASGALRMLELDGGADLAESVATHFDRILEEGAGAFAALPAEPFADTISGLEYYVELTALCDVDAESVLDFAARALDRITLEAPVLPVVSAGSEGGGEEAECESVAATGAPISDETIAEIHEIFIEEARDQLEKIRGACARWHNVGEDADALATLRRGFHTLKGSGRMVGARDLGEFAWSIENLLNRVIDGTLPATSEIRRFLDAALEIVPELVDAEAERRAPRGGFLALEAQAFRLAGEPLPDRLREVETVAAVAPAPSSAVVESGETGVAQSADLTARDEQASRTAVEGLAEASEEAVEETPAVPDDDSAVPEGGAQLARETSQQLVMADTAVPQSEREAGKGAEADEIALTASAAVGRQPPPLALDPVLADIFVPEAKAHLRDVDGFLETLGSSAGNGEVSHAVTRAFHTLHGSSHMAGITPIAELSAAAEALLRHLQEAGRPVDAPVASSLTATAGMIKRIVGAINQPDAVVPAWQALCAELLDLASAVESVPEEVGGRAPGPVAERGPGGSIAESAPEPVAEHAAAEASAPAEPAARKPPIPPAAKTATAPAIDAEVLEIFLEEARELYEQMERAYSRWQSGDALGIADLKRVLHTLKGGARLAGIPPIGDLSHAFETMLDDMASVDAAGSAHLTLAREACDRLMEQGDLLASGGPVEAFSDLVSRLESATEAAAESAVVAEISAAPAPVPRPEPEQRAEPEQQVEPAQPVEPVQPVEPERPVEPAQPVAPEQRVAPLEAVDKKEKAEPVVPAGVLSGAASSRSPLVPRTPRPAPVREGDRIRISTEMLDSMVDHVGEVSICAARLLQQQHVAQFNLREFEQTVERLRAQLRHLEIESEARIRYRHERESGQESAEKADFDPLELDRFSTIQELSRSLAETVDDLGNIREYLYNGSRDAETLVQQQSRIVSDLQNSLLRTRLVPFTQQVSRLERLVRQTCAPLGKKARLEVEGRETELDRSVLEQTMPLLEHLLRNAVSHGVESPGTRRSQGKPEEGTVTLRLARDGMDVVLSVADDGEGLNAEAIRAKALERGLLKADEPLVEEDVISLILAPGFSTAGQVTQISGRGVGLDVVNSEVKQLGGSLDIASASGRGSTFTIRLPFSLAITDVLLVQIGDEVYAVPHSTVESVVRLPYEKLAASIDGLHPRFEYAGSEYSVFYAGQLFGQRPRSLPDQGKWFPALLVRSGDRRMALHVDSLLGTRQIVLKSLGPQLSVIPWILGGTILGDGRVALIVDMASLVRIASADLEERARAEEAPLRRLTVMVVDDSITVRKVTTRLLERHHMNVVTAKDGVEAVALLQETRPDVMLLDIEMPRMDGFELARHVRNSVETARVPIIMITSRSGEKHRERANAIGVQRYLGKPYQEDELVDAIFDVLAGRAG